MTCATIKMEQTKSDDFIHHNSSIHVAALTVTFLKPKVYVLMAKFLSGRNQAESRENTLLSPHRSWEKAVSS